MPNDSRVNETTPLILSLALPFGAAMVFAVLVFFIPPQPLDPQITFALLVSAALLGIVGPAIGKMLRGKIEAADYPTYLHKAMVPTMVSLAIREAGVILAALYVHFGGPLFRGGGVAGILLLTMFLDARTPTRQKAEFEELSGRRG